MCKVNSHSNLSVHPVLPPLKKVFSRLLGRIPTSGIRRIFIEHAAHDALTLGVGQKFTLIAEQATGRDEECQTGTAALGVHILEFRLAGTRAFPFTRTHAVFRHVNGQFLDRLIALCRLLRDTEHEA